MFEAIKTAGSFMLIGLFAAAPTSTNFTLKSYDFGSGGGTSTSTNYGLNSELGEQSGDKQTSTSYGIVGGTQNIQNANVPPVPTFTNPSNEYDRLRIVIATGGNPTDTKYQIAISNDSFATTSYVQTDNTVGTTNTIAHYQTYATWGSGTGVWIVGLDGNTTYQVKVRALQGNYSGSAYGPIASAATELPSITFSVETSLTSVPPFSIGFTSLTAGVVASGNATAEIGLTTNSINGGVVYVKSGGSLASALAGNSITSASADLSVAQTGYGALVSSASQSSGGPFTATTPYNGAGNNVGALQTTLGSILSTPSAITAGLSSVTLKAKIDAITPSAPDYTDTITFIAAMLY